MKKNDLVRNNSRISSASRVSSLRNLFENNFKLYDITNVFKSKQNKNESLKKYISEKSKKPQFNDKENWKNPVASFKTTSFMENGSCSNYEIENCCCETFLEEYNSTPTFGSRPEPKILLQESASGHVKISSNNSRLEPHFIPYCDDGNEFNGPKYSLLNRKTKVPLMRINHVDKKFIDRKFRFSKSEDIHDKVFQFTAEKTLPSRRESYGFVNFTTASINEGGYMGRGDGEEIKKKIDIEKAGRKDNIFNPGVTRIMNIAGKKNSTKHLTKSRLTVKGVKNRNMRNIKRRQRVGDEKSLKRSQSYNGYDNLAYHPCANENYMSNVSIQSTNCEGNSEDSGFPNETHTSGYNWPVTSLYTEGKQDMSIRSAHNVKYSSTSDLCTIHDLDLTISKNRKRYSLSYCETSGDGLCPFNRIRRSFDDLKHLPTYETQMIAQENKLTKHKKNFSLDIHTDAFFDAVEHGYYEKVRTALESNVVDVKSLNSDELSSLDIAVLLKNKPLALLLISFGAQEGYKFCNADDLRKHLSCLLLEAENCILDLGAEVPSLFSSCGNIHTSTNYVQNGIYSVWRRRTIRLKRMLAGLDQIKPPGEPSMVEVEVTNITSIMVRFTGNENKDSSIVTKFKVEWSMDKDFSSISGQHEITDTRQLQYQISELQAGYVYHVRVAGGNLKGYSPYRISSPPSIRLSSWRDLSGKIQYDSPDTKDVFNFIFTRVAPSHPYLKMKLNQDGDELIHQRRKRAAIRCLFATTAKFQKHLKRGVYLSCLLYHEDKLMVTNEDILPVIEIDENQPNKIHNDFHWLLKVAFCWNDVKWFKHDLEKCCNSSMDFRTRLLHAIEQMQAALGVQDLGRVYPKLIQDKDGTSIISLINYVPSPKYVSILNMKWISLAKLTYETKSNICNILMASIPHQIAHHKVSYAKLPKGLYVGYLKINSSVESIEIMVPSHTPNIIPHFKVRDNPYVTAEEWEWMIKKEDLRDALLNADSPQRMFVDQIVFAVGRLLKQMGVPEEKVANHRFYNVKVIEIHADVSFIVLIPPIDTACSVHDSKKTVDQLDILPLTVQMFEMLHFGTYQMDLIATYSRLSNIIETDVNLARYNLRQAFSSSEACLAKSKVVELEKLLMQLNTAWKNTRWLLDVLSFARDKCSPSITVRHLLNVRPKRVCLSIESSGELVPKMPKSRNICAGTGDAKYGVSEDENVNSTLSGISRGNLKTKLPRYNSLSLKSVSYSNSHGSKAEVDVTTSAICPTLKIEIYAAYDTGFSDRPCFKFHVSPKTTAQELVEMFVKQTNMSTLLKGKNRPLYSDLKLNKFCLVSVIGDREYCLNDEFRLVQLQEPWRYGRLYVRRKSDVLAAIKCYPHYSSYV